jgi:N-terminal domain of anti-restriction factor ArdC
VSTTDKIRQLHETLLTQVQALVDGDDWREFLAVATRFHRYSANNVFLILAQRPDATRVAGYRRWQSLGRQVRKGERGIAILAPCVYRARALDHAEANEAPEVARVLRGFRAAHVWDVSQTGGEPLPDVQAELLSGDGPAGLWAALASQVGAAGFELVRGPCGQANGVTDYEDRTVTVRADVDGAQAAKTLAHELAHVLLHDGVEALARRDLAEVEAESVAYLVCHSAALASDGYSLPYVARWSGGDPAQVRLTAERVITTARRVLEEAGLGTPVEDVVPA